MSSQSPGNLGSLEPADLESVVEIDRRITGRSRRVFFEKRVQAALADPSGFIAVAVESGGVLSGFAIGRLQNGEFGDDRRVAVPDALRVETVRTTVTWNNFALLGFLSRSGFTPAQQLVLGRPVT